MFKQIRPSLSLHGISSLPISFAKKAEENEKRKKVFKSSIKFEVVLFSVSS
jgi:hypothetical protein